MHSILRTVLYLVLVVTCVRQADGQRAAFQDSHSYLGGGVGVFTYHGPIDLLSPGTGSNFTNETEPAASIWGSFPIFGDWMSFRFMLIVANFNTTDGVNQVGSGSNEFLTKRLVLFEPEILVSLPSLGYGRMVPYLFAGFGGTLADFHGTERNVVNVPGSGIPGPERSVFHIPIGAGIDIPVSEKYSIYGEASWRMDFNYVFENEPNYDSHSTSLISAGVRFCLDCSSKTVSTPAHGGGGPPPPPPPPPPPAPFFHLTIASETPSSGVSIDVMPVDGSGQKEGATQFIRTYKDSSRVMLVAPNTAGGNRFKHWLLDDLISSQSERLHVTMTANHTATAVYEVPPPTYELTISSETPSSGVWIDVAPIDQGLKSDGSTRFIRSYDEGTQVKLIAPPSAGANRFMHWLLDGNIKPPSNTLLVTMDSHHTARAVYEAPPPMYDLTVSSQTPTSGVPISVAPSDSNGAGDDSTHFVRTYAGESRVTLVAPTTAGGNRFKHWALDGVLQPSNGSLQVIMNDHHTATAVYEVPPQSFDVTVASETPSSGVLISVEPSDQNGIGDGSTPFIRSYDEATPLTLIAPGAAGGNRFKHWVLDGTPQPPNASLQMVMSGHHKATAVYELPPPAYDITIASITPTSGVQISVSPLDKYGAGADSTHFVRTYDESSKVTLVAPDSAGDNRFIYWILDGTRQPSNKSLEVVMSTHRSATAVYEAPPPAYDLTIESKTPTSGVSIQVDPVDKRGNGEGSTPSVRTYNAGTRVTLVAPDSAGGNGFKQWLLDGMEQTFNDTLLVTMNAHFTATAVYEVPAKPPCAEDDCDLVARADMRFYPDSTVWTEESTTDLNEFKQALSEHKTCCMRIVVHAAGEKEEARTLAERRIQAIRGFLIANGVPDDRISHHTEVIAEKCSVKRNADDPQCEYRDTAKLEPFDCPYRNE